jgi:hypothetical protein
LTAVVIVVKDVVSDVVDEEYSEDGDGDGDGVESVVEDEIDVVVAVGCGVVDVGDELDVVDEEVVVELNGHRSKMTS